MKKIIILLSILSMGLVVQAEPENFLHTIVLEGTADGYNIILKTDRMPSVKKTIKGNNNLILDIKGVTTSNSVNAIYKSTSDVSGLVIENTASDELKVYIQAKDIVKATVLAQTTGGSPVILSEHFPVERVIWSLAVLGILSLLIRSAKKLTDYENSIAIKRDIKDREIELYRNFQRELATLPKINAQIPAMSKSRRNYKELARM